MQRLIEQYPLQRGSHPHRDDGMCAMEMVAWLAGEAHSDEPECACPVIASLVRACNDSMSDPARNRYLRPLVPQLVQTRADRRVEQARGMLAIDCRCSFRRVAIWACHCSSRSLSILPHTTWTQACSCASHSAAVPCHAQASALQMTGR